MSAPQIGEDTKVTLDLKTIGMIVTFVITITAMYFALQSDIARAMELPEPEISKVEYELKDELNRIKENKKEQDKATNAVKEYITEIVAQLAQSK